MNCLQFFIFTRFFAVHFWQSYCISCCELLTIFYLYKVLCSTQRPWTRATPVVNCLQFFIFTRFFAVTFLSLMPFNGLWIAYNFLSLQGSLQFCFDCYSFFDGCELLTIFYLYKVLCSNGELAMQWWLLWIAYNFLSLQGSLQLRFSHLLQYRSCELLTIFYLYKVLCSEWHCVSTGLGVVNCLQFFIFTRFFAVFNFLTDLATLLWIAYNFLSLQGSLQFHFVKAANNDVVNCLQFFIFTRKRVY